ncbi:SDR family oxidoreductase [Streptomonospora sediminis]
MSTTTTGSSGTTDTAKTARTAKTVFVTGASSGIGAAIATRAASAGDHVVLAARRADRLGALVERITAAGGSAQACELDITDAAAVTAAVDKTAAERGSIDAIVNNAGVMLLSPMDSLRVDEWSRMVDVNVKGLLNGVAAALPHFREQGHGHLLTVASIGAHQVVPTSAVYSGTKFAAWAITEGLRQELDPAIRVTTISPGVVESELAEHITDPAAKEAMVSYRAAALPAEAIAGAVTWAMDQPGDVDVNEIVVRPTRQRP